VFPRKVWAAAVLNEKESAGVLVAVATLVVNNGDSAPALKLVTVPVVAAEQAGTPAVEMALRNWLALQVRDSTPPKVVDVGAGILAAGTVPLVSWVALSAVSPAPLPVKELLALENVSALLYVPLNTAEGIVPLARLLALREVRAEPFPECVPVKELEAFENVFCPVMDCVVVRST
jgi:hypothetical protein